MDYQFFESLTMQEAHDFLKHFIEMESRALDDMKPIAEEAGVVLDFTLPSVPRVLKWIMGSVNVKHAPVPTEEPEWVHKAHEQTVIEFDEESRVLILRASYYLGECFVRSSQRLSWAVGSPEYIENNMPVVNGFRSEGQMAPMMVVENIYARILGDSAPATEIDRALNSWAADIP